MGVKISSILPSGVPVSTGKGEFEVYGLSIEEVSSLIDKYRDQIATLFAPNADGSINYAGVMSVAPEMTRKIIAMGARVPQDDEEEMRAISQLPGGVQLTALAEIWGQTLPEPKKFHLILSSLMEGVKVLGSTARRRSVPIPIPNIVVPESVVS